MEGHALRHHEKLKLCMFYGCAHGLGRGRSRHDSEDCGWRAQLGGSGDGVYQTRRGMEKAAFYATIVLSIIFVGLALYQLTHS